MSYSRWLIAARPVVFVGMSGAAAGVALFVPVLWPVVFVVLLPLLAGASRADSRLNAGLLGWAWGAGLMGVSLSFLFAMLPLDWLGIANPLLGAVAVTVTWLIAAGVLALPVGLFGIAVRELPRAPFAVSLAAIPALWVLTELARATLYSIAVLGPGTSVAPTFTVGFLGYAFAWAEGLLVLAPVGGPLFLSACIVLVNTVTFLVIERRYRARPFAGGALCAATMAALAVINGALPPFVQATTHADNALVNGSVVALVHTDTDPTFTVSVEIQRERTGQLANGIVGALRASPEADLIILPEDSRFLRNVFSSTSTEAQMAVDALIARKVLLVDSSRLRRDGVVRDVLYAYDFALATTTLASPKSYLVPYGEYVPYAARSLARLLGLSNYMERLAVNRASYVPGPWDAGTRILEHGGQKYGILSCSELFNPAYMRDLARSGADAIVMLSSQSWIRQQSPILFNQMIGMAIVQSAWLRKPYLQATNHAPNVAISPF
jgi:apolipoprotein N-acyltransferase